MSCTEYNRQFGIPPYPEKTTESAWQRLRARVGSLYTDPAWSNLHANSRAISGNAVSASTIERRLQHPTVCAVVIGGEGNC